MRMAADVGLAAVVLLALQTVVVALVAMLVSKGNIYKTIIGVAIVTAPAAWLADRVLFLHPLDPDGRLFMVVLHLALGGFLFQFMTLPDRSVTLRILAELQLAPGHKLSLGQLRDRYSVRTMIESRLEQLAAGGFLVMTPDGSIALQPRGLKFGRFVAAGRRLFNISSAN
jgi:hypothetical protein